MDFLLHGRIFGLPAWLVGVGVIGAGLGIYLVIKNRTSSSSSTGGVLGQNTSTAADPNLDPNTGIPYTVEEATDPNTGLPVYLTLMNQGNGLPSTTPTPAPGDVPPPGPPAATPPTPAPIPPQPGPGASPTASASPGGQVTPNTSGAIQPAPPQPGPGGGGGAGAKPGFAPHPPQPAKGTAVPSGYGYQATAFWPYDLMAKPWEERA